jgi:hypothetical protein
MGFDVRASGGAASMSDFMPTPTPTTASAAPPAPTLRRRRGGRVFTVPRRSGSLAAAQHQANGVVAAGATLFALGIEQVCLFRDPLTRNQRSCWTSAQRT